MAIFPRFKIACLAAGMLLISGELWAHEYQASTADEFAQLASKLQAGDTITLKDGEWRNVDILFEGAGTAEAPITLRAATPGKVVISGRSGLRIAGSYLIVDGLFFHQAQNDDHLIAFRKDSKRLAGHCRLTNCAIVDCNAADAANESRWIAMYGDHNRVDHCCVEGKRTKGTTVAIFLSDEPAHHRLDHNYFGRRPELKKNGGETIRVGDSKTSLVSSQIIVEHNLFEECNGESEIISNKSCDNIYRHNTFLRAAGALTLRHGHRCLVEGNFFIGEKVRGTGGVRIIGEGHRIINNYFADLQGDDQRAALSIMDGLEHSPAAGYAPVKDALVAFNTFVNCKQSIVVGLKDDDIDASVPPGNCTLAYNLVVSRRPAIEMRSKAANFHWQGNLIQSAAPLLEIGGVQKFDDLFLAKDEQGIWRPTETSPAIGAAAGIISVEFDIDGQRRERPADVGCDEVSTTSEMKRPLQSADVGPSWQVRQPALSAEN